MILPSGKKVFFVDLIIPNGNFTWKEALWSDTAGYAQEPANLVIEQNIIRAAQEMQKIREILGNFPLTVTSWYRNPIVNKLVGGEINSVHTKGLAVDFVHPVYSPLQIHAKLNDQHSGGMGTYKNFTHIDWRGYKVRW